MSSAKDKAKEAAVEVKEAVVEGSKEATSDLVKSVRAFAAGGVGGIFAVLTGHPFDLVKVNLQTAEKGAYSGAMDVVRKIVAKRGAAVSTLNDTVESKNNMSRVYMLV
jgi:solute carrier family 25 carnitine/acylcarnitine transporter 20/29